MDITENKGGWIIAIITFITLVLKTIGILRKKEKENE